MRNILISLVIFAVFAFAAFSLLVCWSCIMVGARYDEESKRYAQTNRQEKKISDCAVDRMEKPQDDE